MVSISEALNHVGLSTPHVEVMAMNQGARVGSWLRNLYFEICRPIADKTLLLSDLSVARASNMHYARDKRANYI